MRQTPDRQLRTRNVLIGVALVVVVGALLLLWNREALFTDDDEGPAPPGTEAEVSEGVGESGRVVQNETGQADTAPGVTDPDRPGWPGNLVAWPEDLSSPLDCDGVERELAMVCSELATRDYLRPLAATGGPCALLRQAGEALAARPPVLSAELRSHESMLSNVFHLFRVLGRERMRLLRTMLVEERELAEPLSLVFFRWAVSRERCAEADPNPIRLDTLYDYSSYVFGTMGGQAYLRRRCPEVEALTCFYALQIIDDSIARGHNPHGVDPRSEIPRCRDLVEALPLFFSEHYRENMQRMETRWRGGPPTASPVQR